MKKVLMLIFVIYLFNVCFAYANEDKGSLSPENIVINQIDNVDTQELQDILNTINRDFDEFFPKIEIKSFLQKLIRGEETLSFKQILLGSLNYLFREIVANWKLLGQIIILSAICSILSNLQSAFENDVVAKLAYNACYLVIASITIRSFIIAINLGKETIDMMVTFMQTLMPILLAMIIAMGGITTSAFFQAFLIGAIGIIGTVIKTVVLPLVLFSAVLSIVNNFSTKIQVTKLATLIKQAAALVLGFMFTAFVGVITVQGLTSSTVDGITIRTAKFAVDKFVPIVGGFLSDAMDTVIGASLILKNGIGAIGFITIFLICLMPVIKILALIAIYKLCAAVVEPLSQSNLVKCLNEMSGALVLLFATISSVAIMFFITIAIIVGTGNITVMMR
ncbi:stage III sporulation protein AE [Serpentinicella alkaliphila]|uniref:Stage III sporulation protein AE n=1 Tax=Serpentinicella alkaliphila TaxID=1734049 RepID=A0A4R2TNP2_9FIRM|nr:stage III sporulation protein AE [Serpentinicella alkaliphila]QUH26646.1 stage III sporulation protein AE [Serpentinicella alkaliphila]TCQ02885.1 stage III sporulation protein AE [Serpentinicella alkaliphila]